MKRILAVSDTHGKEDLLKKVVKDNAPLDMFIFCGDGEGLENRIRSLVGEDCELHMVRGNNDYFSELPRDEEFMLGAYKVFLTHGHMFGVNISLRRLSEEARERGCAYAFFGHTHRPQMEEADGVTCINPGSLSYPRQFDRKPSFLLIEEDESGRLHFHQAYAG